MTSFFRICCGAAEEEKKHGAFVHRRQSEYSDFSWNDEIARRTLEQNEKIRLVEHQVTLLNKHRPASSRALLVANKDHGKGTVNTKEAETQNGDDKADDGEDPILADDSGLTQDHHIMRLTIKSKPLNMNYKFNPPFFPKTDAQKEFLTGVLKQNFLFQNLIDAELDELINAMQQETVPENHVIIQQGDTKGEYYYIVRKGKVHFVLEGQGVVGECHPGGSFGELALLYDCPRAASCIAASPKVKLWKVDQKTFRYLLAQRSYQHQTDIIQLLRKVSLFQNLGIEELNRFTDSLTLVSWKAGGCIVQKGEEGKVFYIVQSGKVKIHDIGLGQSQFEDHILGPGEWFGERALLTGEPRAANVTAVTDVTTLAMDRETFENVLGPLKSLMEREMRRNILKGLSIFANGQVTNEELSQLVDLMREVCYKKGTKLAVAGEPYPMTLWIIRHGSLLVYSCKSDSQIYHLQSGDQFGDKSVKGDVDHISTHTAVCEENITAWILTRKDIESVVGDISRLGSATSLVDQKESPREITISDLTKRRVLGQGAFGKVWLVSHNETCSPYAMKEIIKHKVLETKQVKALRREKEFLCQLKHPFILQMVASFQDESRVYFLFPVIPGGELFNVLHKQKIKGRGLPNDSAAFYAACVIEALGHFHQRSIAYRDLKLENVLIDEQGYCKIVDLGFAKIVKEKTYTLVGTPEYLAPCVLLSKGHDKSVDYWAFGVLTYELVVGTSPFYVRGSSQMDLFKRIILGTYSVPEYMDPLLKHMISRLLNRDPMKRLGNLANGYIDIKREPWFEQSSIHFPSIRRKEAAAPWVPPKVSNPLDTSNFDVYSSAEKEVDTSPCLTKEEQEEFQGF